MAKFALYALKYTDLFTPNLFQDDPNAGMQDRWSDRQELFGNLFAEDSSITFQPIEGKKTYPHRVYHCKANPKIIIMRFANVKEMIVEQDFEEKTIEHNPSCYVIIDNREHCRRIAIQKLRTSFSSTDQVARIIEICVNEALKSPQLSVSLTAQRYPLDFYKLWNQEALQTERLRFHISSDILVPTAQDPTDAEPESESETEYLIRMEEAGRNELDANCYVEYSSRKKGSPLRLNESSQVIRRLVHASAGSGTTIELITLDGAIFECYIDTDLESDDKIVTHEIETEWLETIFDINRKPDVDNEQHAKDVERAEAKVLDHVGIIKREVLNPENKEEVLA